MRIFLQTSWTRLAGAVLFLFIALTLFVIATGRGLCRDEHQFVAAGANSGFGVLCISRARSAILSANVRLLALNRIHSPAQS
jgi:hypothetical protein